MHVYAASLPGVCKQTIVAAIKKEGGEVSLVALVMAIMGEQGVGSPKAFNVHKRESFKLSSLKLYSDPLNRSDPASAPTVAPVSCAAINAGTSPGAIPAKVSDKLRATVMAGLAKLVEDVNQ